MNNRSSMTCFFSTRFGGKNLILPPSKLQSCLLQNMASPIFLSKKKSLLEGKKIINGQTHRYEALQSANELNGTSSRILDLLEYSALWLPNEKKYHFVKVNIGMCILVSSRLSWSYDYSSQTKLH